MSDLRLQGSKVSCNRPRLAPHGLVQITAAEQEEQEHDHRIEIGVLRVIDGLDHRHDEGEHDADHDRHVHVGAPVAQGAERALDEGLAGIGHRRQGDQGREPMEEVAGLLGDVGDVAGPDGDSQQHDVHGGEAGDGETFQQPLRTAGLLFLHEAGLEGVCLVAEPA